jgi:hypothetical protein
MIQDEATVPCQRPSLRVGKAEMEYRASIPIRMPGCPLLIGMRAAAACNAGGGMQRRVEWSGVEEGRVG